MYIQLVFRIIDKDEKMHVPFIEIQFGTSFIFFYIFYIFLFLFNKDEVDIGFTTVTEFCIYLFQKIPIPLNSTTGVQQQK